MIRAFFAISSPPRPRIGLRRRPGPRVAMSSSVLLEREAQPAQERPAFLVGRGRGDDGDVHAARPVDGVRVDLVEHRLLVEAERVVAPTVELRARETAEVADTGQCDREQPVEELPHAVAPQRDLRADRHALAQLELSDGLGGPADLRLLAGDGGQVAHGAVDELRVAGGLADPHVDDDLHHAGDLHDVAVGELLLQLVADLGAVALLEPGLHLLGGGHLRSPYRCAWRSGPAAPWRRSHPRRASSRCGWACRRSRTPSRWTR